MADINNITANVDLGGVLTSIPGVSSVIQLSKVAIIVVIVYIIFLTIRSITQILYSLRFKKLYKNVEDINNKMDVLIGKKKGKK